MWLVKFFYAKDGRWFLVGCPGFLLIVVLFHVVLPDVTFKDFVKGDPLKVRVQKLVSLSNGFDSYYSLPYCPPNKTVKTRAENTSAKNPEFLLPNVIENSPYEFKMQEPQMCKVVCRTILRAEDVEKFKEKIDDEYWVNMILDFLPLVMPYKKSDMDPLVYQSGFPVGVKVQHSEEMEPKYFINNHLTFTVKYHKDGEINASRIVGFEVKPFSVDHEIEGKHNNEIRLRNCDPHANLIVTDNETHSPVEVEDQKEIIFTYDVEFQESEIKWASRWVTFLYIAGDCNHMLSFGISLVIIGIFFAIVLDIMESTLNAGVHQLETQEEIGWIKVLGDVFRPPINSDLLCVCAGTGVQCFGMILVIMVFTALGFLSPSERGRLVLALLFLWDCMGLFAGYTSARLHKMFNGTKWMKIALKTAVLFPGTVFAIFFFLNVLTWVEEPSGAIPFVTLFALVLLWFCTCVPLVLIGSYVGFRKPAIQVPVRSKKVPRQIPKQAWFKNPVFTVLIGGVIPFAGISIEVFFIFTSIWFGEYYIWRNIFMGFFILIISCAEISVVLCYFQLCREDYMWWWKSFLSTGSTALYFFLYAAFYFTKLDITKPVSGILYFGYTLIASYALFVLTGTIGFFASLFFTRRVYSSIEFHRKAEAFESRV